jgi:mRNA-degrading endonuclease HigB of HigAB toxin-antitoxin module
LHGLRQFSDQALPQPNSAHYKHRQADTQLDTMPNFKMQRGWWEQPASCRRKKEIHKFFLSDKKYNIEAVDLSSAM